MKQDWFCCNFAAWISGSWNDKETLIIAPLAQILTEINQQSFPSALSTWQEAAGATVAREDCADEVMQIKFCPSPVSPPRQGDATNSCSPSAGLLAIGHLLEKMCNYRPSQVLGNYLQVLGDYLCCSIPASCHLDLWVLFGSALEVLDLQEMWIREGFFWQL